MANQNNQNVLQGSNVKIDELSKHISKSGVIVKPHIGRIRRKVALPKELLGTVNSSDQKEDEEFFREYITQGTLNLIPKSDEKTLVSIETCVRQQVGKLAIACDGTFMTSQVYKDEYLPYFNEKKTKYFEKRDEIVAKWDILVQNFKTKLETFLDRRNITNKQAIVNGVMSNVPSRQAFSDSFYMEIALTAFPVEENIDMFDSIVADQVKNSITNTKLTLVKEMLGTLLGETFTRINNMLIFYRDNAEIKNQQVKPLRELKKNLIKNNILGHELIDGIVQELTTLEKIDINDTDCVAEQAEIVMVKAYGFIKDTGLDEYIKKDDLAMTELDMARQYITMNPNSVVIQTMLEEMDETVSA